MSKENINSVKRSVEIINSEEKGKRGVKNGENVVERKEEEVLNVKKIVTEKEEIITWC
jgi:hypothetical protein